MVCHANERQSFRPSLIIGADPRNMLLQGKSEEEVLAIGKAAAAEAAAVIEKAVEDKDDMDDDAQARYYRCDHGDETCSRKGVGVPARTRVHGFA